MTAPTYYANWELVEDTSEYEYKYRTYFILNYVSVRLIRRKVRSKTYEATIQETPGVTELPAPSYLAGNTDIEANPENLSPVGSGPNEWHCDNVSYSKSLSVPLSRSIRVTWVRNGVWEEISDSSTSE